LTFRVGYIDHRYIERRSITLRQPDVPSEAGVLILLSLATGPKHGYAIMTDISAFANTRLGPGTLYTALARLEEDGLIAAVASGDRRRPYRITPLGLTTLRTRAESLRRLANVATRRLAAR
jgi:DNA-binding PadR family transcriptional regulator